MLSKDVHHQSGAQQANVQLELTPKCKGCPMGFRSALVLMSTVGLFTLGFLAPWGATRRGRLATSTSRPVRGRSPR
jgi:hypothetical protein